MDRLKYRVWDKRLNRYLGKDDPTQMLLENGNLAYLNDEGMKFYEVEFCTGLYDKNYKLIYEGDIVKDIEGYIGQVKFCDGTARFIIEFAEDISDFSRDMPHELKIIGNIHENADLLGED